MTIRAPVLVAAALAAVGCASAPSLDEDFHWPSGDFVFFGLIESRDRLEGTVIFHSDLVFTLYVRGVTCADSSDWRVPRARQISVRCSNFTLEFDMVGDEPHAPARVWLEMDQVVERRGSCLRFEGGRCLQWQTIRVVETVRRPGTVTLRRP